MKLFVDCTPISRIIGEKSNIECLECHCLDEQNEEMKRKEEMNRKEEMKRMEPFFSFNFGIKTFSGLK